MNETEHLAFDIESMSPLNKTSQHHDFKRPFQFEDEPVCISKQETQAIQILPMHKDEIQPQENIENDYRVAELVNIIESPENAQPGPNNQAMIIANSPNSPTQSLQNVSPSGEHSPNRPIQVVEPHTWIYRLVSFLIAMTLLSAYVLMMPLFDNISDGIFIIIEIHFVFVLFLDLFRRSPILNICDALSGALYVCFLYLKKLEIISICSFACAPFMLEVLGMLVYRKKTSFTRQKFFMRVCYATQSLLIALKMDNKIELNWLIVLSVSLAYVTFFSSYLLIKIVAITLKLRNLNSLQINSLPRMTKKIGALSYIGYYVLTLLSVFGLCAVATALESPGDDSLLISTAYIGLGICPLFVAWILITKKPLLRFIRAYQLDTEEEELSIDEPTKLQDIKIVSFRVEKKESYFVKLSPTYFQSADQDISSVDKERLYKLKQALYNIKQDRRPKKISSQEPVNKSVSGGKNLLEQESFTRLRLNTKLAYSVNDIDEIRRINALEESSSRPNEDDNLCYICYRNTSDAILGSCGHGGICYDCATVSIKKNPTCSGCRRDVTEIYKIEPCVKFRNIVKGLEISKVVIIKNS